MNDENAQNIDESKTSNTNKEIDGADREIELTLSEIASKQLIDRSIENNFNFRYFDV